MKANVFLAISGFLVLVAIGPFIPMPIGLLALTGVEANETPANGFEFAEGSVAGMDVDFVTADANDVVANGLFEVTFVGVKAGAGVAADGVLSVPILLFFHLLRSTLTMRRLEMTSLLALNDPALLDSSTSRLSKAS